MHWIFPSVYRLPEHGYSLKSFANGTGGIVLIGRIMRKKIQLVQPLVKYIIHKGVANKTISFVGNNEIMACRRYQ
jgi:hypothetical protein